MAYVTKAGIGMVAPSRERGLKPLSSLALEVETKSLPHGSVD